MKHPITAFLALGGVLGAFASPVPGIPRDSNTGNTGGYDSTRIEARLVVPVQDNTRVVHFIRDNNDPRVITKTYELKNVDPYEFRDYLRQMVQSKRVGNTSLQQQYPSNAQTSVTVNGQTVTLPVTATVSSPELGAASAQPGYTPTVQLGSNTAVECLKYADGTGLLIVSAEEYRFRDQPNGMGIDSLVARLDNSELGALSYGSQMFIYMPKFVPARNLMPLIENMGMNISDVTELWQGQDLVAYDPDLNWLVFDVENYSCANIAAMLAKYDVPIPQVRLQITVYEIDTENDDKLGLDFQSWKNNEGVDLFSAGGRYRNNWNALYDATGLNRAAGSERTSFYNFNPRWNTRYIDFLTSIGKARIAHTGELCIRNASSAALNRTTQIFYMDDSEPAPGSETDAVFPNTGVGPYQLLSNLIGAVTGTAVTADEPVRIGKGNQQITTKSTGYGFSMQVDEVSVNLEETRFKVSLSNSSLIGFQSSGAPRIAAGNRISQVVSLPHGRDSFIIGGLKKQESVTSRTGVPWLMDIPYLGHLFSTKSTSVKNSELVVVASCRWEAPPDKPGLPARSLNKTR